MTLAATRMAEAQLPALSITFIPPATLRFSWPSNFTSANWQLVSTTNPASATWQPVSQSSVSSGEALVVLFPITNLTGYFRLQQIGAGGSMFQAAPPVITAGGSSTLSWSPEADTTYTLSPGPGVVTNDSLVVSPAVTTVYSLTASNALGVATSFATVIVNPCGWLQVNNLVATLAFSYDLTPSTPAYSFSISHFASVTFHLSRQSSTATDAYFFGFAVHSPDEDVAQMNDREVDTTPQGVFTTTEVGSRGPPAHNVSTLSLHVTCSTYDFSYSVLMTTTESDAFGTSTSLDGVGAGAIASRPLPVLANVIDDDTDVVHAPAEYPPTSLEYFSPDSALGKHMFEFGVVTDTTAGDAIVAWTFTPVP